MSNNKFEKEKIKMTPETGFNLVGIDYFENPGNQLYIVEHFDMYQDALTAKKYRKIQDEYFILYKDQNNEFCARWNRKIVNCTKFYKIFYHRLKKVEIMTDETNDIIDTIYEKKVSNQAQIHLKKVFVKVLKQNIKFLMNQNLLAVERY